MPTDAPAEGEAPAPASTFDFTILSIDDPDRLAATIAAQPPTRRAEIVERVASLRGNTFTAMVVDRLDALGSTDHIPARKRGRAEREEDTANVAGAVDALAIVTSTILPAYEDALTALDVAGAQSLHTAALDAYASAVALRDALRRSHAHDDLLSRLEDAIAATEGQLAASLTGRTLHGRPVLAGVAPLALAGAKDPAALLRREASLAIEVVATAQQVIALVAPGGDGTDGPVSTDQAAARSAAALVHPLRTRPLSFALAKALLVERGVWSTIEHVTTPRAGGWPFGPTLAADDQVAAAQATEFGATDDLRGFDLGRAESVLWANAAMTTMAADQGIDVIDPGKLQRTESAKEVLGMIYSADPAARGHILEALDRRGLLVALLDPLPFGDVERLHDALPRSASFVRAELRPYFQDKDRSNHSVSHYLGKLPGGPVWKFGANVGTFGFVGEHDAAYAAERRGDITPGQYDAATDKGLQRAVAIGAASTLTGGAAGAYAEGLTVELAAGSTAGRYASTVIVGAAAGAAGGLGAQAGSDLVDQRLSSPSDYALAGGVGGGIGGGLAVVGGLGAHGAKYLPPGVQTLAQKLVARFPHHSDVFEVFRDLGREHQAQLRIKVGRLLQLADDLHVPGVRPALAAASAGRPLGPEDDVLVTARADQPFNAPGDLDGPAPITVLKVERLPEDSVSLGDEATGGSGSLFDDYGPEASYADDLADWHDTPAVGDDLAELGLAEPEASGLGRRVRHVEDEPMPAHLADEAGMSTLSDVRLGITREPRHHILPQEELEWFQARGFPGRDIDQFTIEIPTLEHDLVHGGNQGLARTHWKEREWNTELMTRLRGRELRKASRVRARLGAEGTDPATIEARVAKEGKLTRDEILAIAQEQMSDFSVALYPFVPYHAP